MMICSYSKIYTGATRQYLPSFNHHQNDDVNSQILCDIENILPIDACLVQNGQITTKGWIH